jgi:hypothetical protein
MLDGDWSSDVCSSDLLRIEHVGTPSTGGAGIWASGDSMTRLERFVVRDAASVGLSSTTGPVLSLSQGLIAESPSCTSSESPLDLTTVGTDQCGDAPVTWTPPAR